MNRRELVRRVANAMRDKNIRKHISYPRQVFHISDDEGHTKDFIIRKSEKDMLYTADDVGAMLDTCLFVIEEALKQGEQVSIHGFGSLGLKFRKARATKRLGTDEWIDVDARYVPKFTFGNDLRMCAKVYELSLQDHALSEPLPVFDDTEEDPDGE